MIYGGAGLVSIVECMKTKYQMLVEQKAVSEGTFKVAKQVLELSPVNGAGVIHVLTNIVDRKGNIKRVSVRY